LVKVFVVRVKTSYSPYLAGEFLVFAEKVLYECCYVLKHLC